RRQQPDRHQRRNLGDGRGGLVHPPDEHGDHQPVAEVRDALAERKAPERRRPQRPPKPFRDSLRRSGHQAHLIEWGKGGTVAPPDAAPPPISSSCLRPSWLLPSDGPWAGGAALHPAVWA